jgi:hypothetical protein
MEDALISFCALIVSALESTVISQSFVLKQLQWVAVCCFPQKFISGCFVEILLFSFIEAPLRNLVLRLNNYLQDARGKSRWTVLFTSSIAARANLFVGQHEFVAASSRYHNPRLCACDELLRKAEILTWNPFALLIANLLCNYPKRRPVACAFMRVSLRDEKVRCSSNLPVGVNVASKIGA